MILRNHFYNDLNKYYAVQRLDVGLITLKFVVDFPCRMPNTAELEIGSGGVRARRDESFWASFRSNFQ